MMSDYYGADDINEEFDMAAHEDEIAIVPVSREVLDEFAQTFGFSHFEDLASITPQPVVHDTIRAPEILEAAQAAGVPVEIYGKPTPEEIRRAKLERIDDLQRQLDELRSYLTSDQ